MLLGIGAGPAADSFVESRLQRDVLPCPLGRGLTDSLLGFSSVALSPGQKRRVRRRRVQDAWLVEGITALNSLGGQDRTVARDAPLNAGQHAAVRRLAAQYGAVGPRPPGATPAGSYLAIRGEERGYGASAGAGDRVGSVAAYREDALSLPAGRAGVLPLVDAVPDHLHEAVSSGLGLLRSPSEAAEAVKGAGFVPASEPSFARRPRLRGSFLHKLYLKGVIEVGTCRAVAGTFFVRKKGKKIRLIFDTRISNFHFFKSSSHVP